MRRGDLAAAQADAQAAIELAPELLGARFLVLAVSAAVLAGLDRDETPDSLRRLIDQTGRSLRHASSRRARSCATRRACFAPRPATTRPRSRSCAAARSTTTAFGGENPALLPWRSAAALSLAQLGRHDEARELAADELHRAESFGAARAIGIALRAHALVGPAEERAERLSAALERARGLACAARARSRAGRSRRDVPRGRTTHRGAGAAARGARAGRSLRRPSPGAPGASRACCDRRAPADGRDTSARTR